LGVHKVIVSLLFGLSAPLVGAEPTIGQSIVLREIRTTLLDARLLSLDEYQLAHPTHPVDWAGGGFHFTFLVENRAGAILPPAVGEIRVVLGSSLYNSVTNANSVKPFHPLIVIHGPDKFLATSYGKTLKTRAPANSRVTSAVVLDIFVPGLPVAGGIAGFVELEQGETYRPDANGALKALRPDEIAKTWFWSRFEFPPLN
jgi:hypothetical protein